jgi:hypothetical protein
LLSHCRRPRLLPGVDAQLSVLLSGSIALDKVHIRPEDRRQRCVSNNGNPCVAACLEESPDTGMGRVPFRGLLMTSVSTRYIGRQVRRSV